MKYILLLLLLAGCGKKPDNEYIEFVFQLPFQMTPRDTISVGDTLWLTADFPDQLREFNSGNTYSVTPQNIKFKTKLGLFELTIANKDLADQPSASNDFAFVNKTGSLTKRGTTFSPVNYVYANGRYQLRVGLVAQRRGVFCANFLDGIGNSSGTAVYGESPPDLSYLVPGRTAEGGKRIAVFDGFYHYINDGRTNFYLFKQHCLATSLAYPGPGNDNYEQEATYTFVVK